MFTRSSRDSFLLASRISMPTICLFSSRSTVTPSSMSILSSTGASLNWIYKASASLSYSILKTNHLHPSRCSGLCIVDSTSVSVILWSRILFLACLVYLIGFIKKIISDALSTCKQRLKEQYAFYYQTFRRGKEGRWFFTLSPRLPISVSIFGVELRHSTPYTLHPDILNPSKAETPKTIKRKKLNGPDEPVGPNKLNKP